MSVGGSIAAACNLTTYGGWSSATQETTRFSTGTKHLWLSISLGNTGDGVDLHISRVSCEIGSSWNDSGYCVTVVICSLESSAAWDDIPDDNVESDEQDSEGEREEEPASS